MPHFLCRCLYEMFGVSEKGFGTEADCIGVQRGSGFLNTHIWVHRETLRYMRT